MTTFLSGLKHEYSAVLTERFFEPFSIDLCMSENRAMSEHGGIQRIKLKNFLTHTLPEVLTEVLSQDFKFLFIQITKIRHKNIDFPNL